MNDEWDEIGFVISSRYRVEVLRRLSEGPATPTQIASDSGAGIAHISRALSSLRERTLVDLLVSEDRKKGRVYGITEAGEEIWEQIQAENMVE
ncbi:MULTISPECIES: winged helix-turn-helix domain-containing protein [Natranaeroarchaeum]|uniref:Transcriptional regulator containing HTH domain,ArsR family n=2 Tax=Natranaeroarchaeum TaxID=2917705 RepID=A0A897MR10_9EURY|nr:MULTISPECIES: winged helix-turn-helix domain-containing protein [Natranaeroarchaeum]MCL9814038.1 winged helix-turn-helix domain-containing protein [Natranaeroarchaeum aerophilus]QSG03004.1 Transcriptional regulator containing HTH domain,ArsR family [Natranaeroarchaeum sulfidigenes]